MNTPNQNGKENSSNTILTIPPTVETVEMDDQHVVPETNAIPPTVEMDDQHVVSETNAISPTVEMGEQHVVSETNASILAIETVTPKTKLESIVVVPTTPVPSRQPAIDVGICSLFGLFTYTLFTMVQKHFAPKDK